MLSVRLRWGACGWIGPITAISRWGVHEWTAATALAASIALLAVATVRGIRVEPLPADAGAGALREAIPEAGPVPGLPHEQYAAAVDRDPFHPERRRPATRFIVSAGVASAAADPQPAAPAKVDRPPLRLLGTTVLPDGRGLALLVRDGEPPRLLRLGESWDGMELRRVSRGSAMLVSADSTLVLSLPHSGRW